MGSSILIGPNCITCAAPVPNGVRSTLEMIVRQHRRDSICRIFANRPARWVAKGASLILNPPACMPGGGGKKAARRRAAVWPGSGEETELAWSRGALERARVRSEGLVGTSGAVAVEVVVGRDDCFGAAIANDEGLATAPAGLGATIRQIWCDLSHVTAPYRS